MMDLNIVIVCGSVRAGRKSIAVAEYIKRLVATHGHNATLVDFTELPLPFVDTPVTPGKLNKVYPYPNVQTWSNIADAADGFVFVSPEYNHSIPGILKNAIDWLSPELTNKPAGLVGVSNGAIGGARMMEHLRAILGNFGIWSLRETVLVKFVQDVFDEKGALLDPSYETSIEKLLQSLYIKSEALKALRS